MDLVCEPVKLVVERRARGGGSRHRGGVPGWSLAALGGLLGLTLQGCEPPSGRRTGS